MTRVLMSIFLLDYWEGMAQLVRKVCDKPIITGVDSRSRRKERFSVRKDLPALCLDGLLQPPRIEALNPYLFPPENQVDNIIHLTTSGDYGVMQVYVTLENERGNQIESGFALKDETEADDWYYFPSVSLPAGASATVRAIAMDPLGGIGIQVKGVNV